MNEHIQRIMLLEKRCYQMFQAMGWNTEKTMETTLSPGHYFRPDITLSANDQIMGCVEVKTNLGGDRANLLRIVERTEFILNRFKPKVFIFTNGYVFDLYLEGEYFGQLTVVPSPEDIELLLRSKKGGC